MRGKAKTGRRDFLKSAALAGGLTSAAPEAMSQGLAKPQSAPPGTAAIASQPTYPRTFTGPALAMISFPLGGIGAGSIALGGRGQLRDWEMINRADKGNALSYAFPAIWVKAEGQEPVARVLEARIQPPYEGQSGLGADNVPGLSRLEGATFTGEFPRARLDFHDRHLPVTVSLTAGTPFIPLDADESGLPVAVLRYRLRNTGKVKVAAAIAFSIENPVHSTVRLPGAPRPEETRLNEPRRTASLAGLRMHNPALEKADVFNGSFALAIHEPGDGQVSLLRGWPAGPWWDSPRRFWDDFVADGAVGPDPAKTSPVGSVCLQRTIAPGQEAEYVFLLAWHFPNRTPERCGWQAPRGQEKTVIGNWYATRFADAWAAAEYASSRLATLEARTTKFLEAIRQTSVPAVVREAAMSNLSTLVSTTCFRTADGEFHGFEGVNDHLGCCSGNCTHVWNYETATTNLFPALSHSLRRSAFGYSMNEQGGLGFRQLLPDGMQRYGTAAADGQMGQIVKVYLDWQLSGDAEFLREFWPKAKRALEFAWIPGGWDADRDGVMEGVQHNTYDVEFYGPNPLCGIYYLAALRAGEEMARAAGDAPSAAEYRRLFESGSRWIDGNLFNGEYYLQKIEGRPASAIAAGLRGGAGAADPEHPEYQVGDGCLVDQLMGQYLADVAGLGPLVRPENIRKALQSIYRYNHKATLESHSNFQRTFALNDESALVICDYGKGERPPTPFPYYAEVMTGFEYSAACLMLYQGMTERGLACIGDIRRRYDGVRRNPWDEAECGHHYARAMAAWSGLLALSGFRYRGPDRHVVAAPLIGGGRFRSFWSTASGWGLFSFSGAGPFTLSVTEGVLAVRSLELPQAATNSVTLGGNKLEHTSQRQGGRATLRFREEIRIVPGQDLVVRA
ncbi:MAG: GH116 family glycosyl-hydrolase [Acidobacteriota bacterium]